MKKLLTLCIIFYSFFSHAQQYTLPNELVSAYLKDGAKKDMIIETTIDKDDFYEIRLNYNDKSSVFKLKPLTFPSFQSKLKDAIIDVIKQNDETFLVSPLPENKVTQNHIALVFTQFVTYFNTQNERPEVATIYLKESIPAYSDDSTKPKDSTEPKDPSRQIAFLENVSVELSFYGGFIEKMQVNGEIKGIPMSFNNKYSIGISSTKNIKNLSENKIFSNEKLNKEFLEKLAIKPSKKEIESLQKSGVAYEEIMVNMDFQKNKNLQALDYTDSLRTDYNNGNYKKFDSGLNRLIKLNSNQYNNRENLIALFLNVDDVIRYVKKVDVNANDISPVPQLVILDKNQKQTKLFKEESSKLFEAVVFTDFLGVFDEENPNGIIQTEVNKKFNIHTFRSDINHCLSPFFEGYGFFESFTAQFQFSKIEKNNKFLLPNAFNIMNNLGTVTDTISYYKPISLLQYRNFAIGGMLNFMTLENQNAKLNMFLDIGFLFGRSGIKETKEQVEGTFVNNLEIPIELKLQLLPEKRVSFSVSDKLSWFETFDAKIPLKSIEDDLLVTRNRFLNSFNIDLALDISSSGKLFLRYKLIHELDNINTNFSQLQFGYSFYLLQKNGARKNN